MWNRGPGFTAFAIAVALMVFGGRAVAGEGGYSNYIPGFYGDLALAVAPDDGWSVRNDFYVYSADGGDSIRSGDVEVEADLQLAYEYLTVLYKPGWNWLGGQAAFGITGSLGYSDIESTLRLGDQSLSVEDDAFGAGDITLAAYIYWQADKINVAWANYVVTPSGRYDDDDVANVGLNYWTFETDLMVTYFDQSSGRDWSIVLGYGYNDDNDDTRYQTGDEIHLDFVVNQFLSESFAIGVNGFYYKQVGGDSGEGALLGDFKGQAAGFGPAIYWNQKLFKRDAFFTLKWLHEFGVENRLDGDHIYASFALSF